VLLHWLGGSGRTWNETAERLAALGLRTAALDLPGFGQAVDIPGYSTAAMAGAVLATLRTLRAEDPAPADAPATPWLLAGHSMGGKVATALARTAMGPAAHPELAGLAGLILVSPSPPGPEPMKDSKRADLLQSLGLSSGDADEDLRRAFAFLDDNTGKLALDPALRQAAVADVLHMSRAAFTEWLELGSREDHSARIGVLPLPALVIAGREESALGPRAQREHMLPHLAEAELVELERCGHLAPLERPGELAELIAGFARRLAQRQPALMPTPPTRALSPEFAAVLNGPRTSPHTRAVLEARLAPDATPGADAAGPFEPAQLATLRALVACVVPDAGFDLTARLCHALTAGPGKGWRFDTLPPDVEAWRIGLASLDAAARGTHGVAFVALYPALQQELLQRAQEGALGRSLLGAIGVGESAQLFSAQQMQHWFEDVRGLLATLYTADPRTFERIGFTGFADQELTPALPMHGPMPTPVFSLDEMDAEIEAEEQAA